MQIVKSWFVKDESDTEVPLHLLSNGTYRIGYYYIAYMHGYQFEYQIISKEKEEELLNKIN